MLEKTRKGKDAKNTAILRFYFSLRKNPAPGTEFTLFNRIALCIPFARDFFARSQARAHTQHMQNGRLLLNDLACERQLQARNQGGARQGCVRTPALLPGAHYKERANLTCENTVARTHGSLKLRVMGSC